MSSSWVNWWSCPLDDLFQHLRCPISQDVVQAIASSCLGRMYLEDICEQNPFTSIRKVLEMLPMDFHTGLASKLFSWPQGFFSLGSPPYLSY